MTFFTSTILCFIAKFLSIKQTNAPISRRASTIIFQSNTLICIEGIKEGVRFGGRKRSFIGIWNLDASSRIVRIVIGNFHFPTSHNHYNI